LEDIPLIEKMKRLFVRLDAELEYYEKEFRFRWRPGDSKLPEKCGVYCLLSHGDARVQKVGKADGARGLYGRFLSYTAKKKEDKAINDRTDRLWRTIMTDKLLGRALSVYYFVTEPMMIESPIDFDDGVREVYKCQWARDFERSLSLRFREQYKNEGVAGVTHFLLSGAGD
jgi:hypothetical protein